MTDPNPLRLYVENATGLRSTGDVVDTGEGVLAWHTPYIAPFAYLVRLNRPLADHEISALISDFGSEFARTIELLYSAFNGFSLFNSECEMYGIVPEVIDRGGEEIQNIPFDLYRLNDIGRPAAAPENVLIISESGEGSEATHDCIALDGSIVSGRFACSGDILESFESPQNWFDERLAMAAANHAKRYPRQLPDFFKGIAR